jgi:hypothetical protein
MPPVRTLAAVIAVALAFVSQAALAWDTGSCPAANPQSGDCTCVSQGVQSSGNASPIGCSGQFQPGDTIGTWQSINKPPAGAHTWLFDYGYMAKSDGGWQSQFDSNQTVLNIPAGQNFWNAWDNKFTSHPGGRYRVQVYFDGTAVAGGYREFAVCGSDFERKCSGADVYWYDACGQKRGLAESCPSGTCAGATCKSCDPKASTGCSQGDVWYFDCDGSPSSKKTDCGSGTCAGGACSCDTQASTGCSQGDVWYFDCNGSPSSKKTDCGSGTCAGGTCSCDTQASTGCHNGDLYFLDCQGTPTALKQSCQFGACSAGTCPGCDPKASTGCSNGDLYFLDCQGTPTALKTDCGGGTCAGGVCVCDPAAKKVCTGTYELWFADCNGAPTSPAASCLHGCSQGACLDSPPPTPSEDGIELHCNQGPPASVLAWPFETESWHVVSGSPYHYGDDKFADDWNTTLGGCDTEISSGPMWVRAPAAAKVAFVGNAQNGFGHQVILRLDKDPTFFFRTAHLQDGQNKIPLSVGDSVKLGQIIGAVGDTGTACAHGHMVLYCAVTPGSTAESRLLDGRSPTGLTGAASKHATWFTFDKAFKPWLEVGGGFPDCDGGGADPDDGGFIGAPGDAAGCLAPEAVTERWFIGRAGQSVDLDFRAVDGAGEPSEASVSLVDSQGVPIMPQDTTFSPGAQSQRVLLPAHGRYAVLVAPTSASSTLRWRLFHTAVSDPESDDYPDAALTAPGTAALHALDSPFDRDVYLLGAIADRLDVRVAPDGPFAAAPLQVRFSVLRDGELAPLDSTWYALDADTRRLAATDEAVYVEVTGAPGFYMIEVTRPDAAPAPMADASADAGQPESDVASPSDLIARPQGGGGCAGGPRSQIAWWSLLALLWLARRRLGPNNLQSLGFRDEGR